VVFPIRRIRIFPQDQGSPRFGAEIAEKGRLWMETDQEVFNRVTLLEEAEK